MNKYNFGNYLCELREKKGYSQSELGQKLGVTNKAVSKWENGQAYPSVELLLPLANELGVSIEEIFNVINNSKKEKTKLRRILDYVSNNNKIFCVVSTIYSLMILLIFFIFGDNVEKTKLLIITPIISIIIYSFIRLLFYILSKNSMCKSRYIDLMSIIFICIFIIGEILLTVNFITDVKNGYSPNIVVLLFGFLAVLDFNKNNK